MVERHLGKMEVESPILSSGSRKLEKAIKLRRISDVCRLSSVGRAQLS